MVIEGQISQDEALLILENSGLLVQEYVPEGHTFTIYSGDELLSVYALPFGGAIAAFAIIWLLMRTLGGVRYGK